METSQSGVPVFIPANFLLPFLFLGFTEILDLQPWAKGEGAAGAIVPELETGPRTVSGGSLCTSGGGSSGAEPRH